MPVHPHTAPPLRQIRPFHLLFAISLGALVAMNPFYAPHLSLATGVILWCLDLALVLGLTFHPRGALIGIFLSGLWMSVPCFVETHPLPRALLMCGMGVPLLVAMTASLTPNADFRTRAAFFFRWMGRQTVTPRPRSLNAATLLHLLLAILIFVLALAAVKHIPAVGPWLTLRWLTGGIMILAAAEIATASHNLLTALLGIRAPALMRSPFQSASIREFWGTRWNVATSAVIFRPMFFIPLAGYGMVLALGVTFFASALAHLLLACVALGQWNLSLLCGAFFLVQPLLILAERQMRVRSWPRPLAHTWTLTALAITSPLFLEPALRAMAPSWGAPNELLSPTLAVLVFTLSVNLFFAIGQRLWCLPAHENRSRDDVLKGMSVIP